MVRYDPSVIQKYAARLYKRANSIIFVCVIVGLAGGTIGGLALVGSSRFGGNALGGIDNRVVIAVVALVGGLIGYVIGTERAFWYKLQAQLALCQVAIESNTRQITDPRTQGFTQELGL